MWRSWLRLRRRILRLIPAKLWATPSARRWWVAGILYAVMLVILLAGGAPHLPELEEGQVATMDVMAPRDMVDRFRTEQLREEAARQAIREAAQDPANFEINPTVALEREEWLEGLFRALAVYRGQLAASQAIAGVAGHPAAGAEGLPEGAAPEEGPSGPPAPEPGEGGEPEAEEPEAAASSGEAAPPVGVGPGPVLAVSEADVDRVLAYVQREIRVAPSRGWVAWALRASAEDFASAQALAGRMTVDILSRRRIGERDVDAVRADLHAEVAARGVPPHLQDAVAEAVGLALVPNLILSAERVERARQEAMRQVQDVIIRQGQIIVRRGDPILAEHVRLVRELGLTQASTTYSRWLGTAVLVLALFVFIGIYARQFMPEVLEQPRLLLLLGLIAALVTGLARVASLVPWDGALYLVPVALASMLVALLIDSRLAFTLTVALAVVMAAITGGEMGPVLVALAGGVAGVFSVSKISQRGDLTRAGFIVGGVATVVMACLFLLRFIPWGWQYGGLGLVNGVVSAVATIGLLPYLEGAFGITSTIRLLELSNPNQPLLRKLLMEAPGSYHHSIIVGNLSEAAADAIGADSLLVRVGALYHDIGKTKRPYFFVENQFGGENPHDKISPSLSTLIIISHVKDGVEMAREHGLPEPLIAFIREHHGTALVRYFYQKAVENAKGEPVDPKDFSYPGPRPQSRETAIVMLADSVEAAVRSLSQPAPGRIEGLVRKVIKEKLAEGELDESDLTLKDLDRIAEAFVRVLTGIYHKRVEYPELAPGEAEAKGGVGAR